MKERSFRRGEIYIADLNPYIGSEQGGTRPVIILQNNLGNLFSPTLIVAPLTSRLKKRELPTHYLITGVEALKEESLVMLEQIKTIDKRRVKEYIGKVSCEEMNRINTAISVSLGFTIPIEVGAP